MASELTIRFKEAYDYLLSMGEVTGYKDFATKIGISTSMITEIFKGRSNVGATALQNIVLIFKIDGNWLLAGIGEITQNNAAEQLNSPSEAKKVLLNTQKDESILYKIYKEKDEEVGNLKEYIGRLKAYIEFLENKKQKEEIE
ncbi:helix-turn-helix domain-containing protein [Parabacteroides chinchillae]|uniref:HTH cro/C1-type domain-containing protein n=1 Tax=Parabacteroides chinchillae TaxID=871327 RepID=A0A8G2BXK6_9BACT|nr:helix-turn-helix transcriptional regulator [Parabacteroides chinchillae]SEG05852.1 hypothetical protein SAMN05444001_11388 [Parabacteroides chinchillae]